MEQQNKIKIEYIIEYPCRVIAMIMIGTIIAYHFPQNLLLGLFSILIFMIFKVYRKVIYKLGQDRLLLYFFNIFLIPLFLNYFFRINFNKFLNDYYFYEFFDLIENIDKVGNIDNFIFWHWAISFCWPVATLLFILSYEIVRKDYKINDLAGLGVYYTELTKYKISNEKRFIVGVFVVLFLYKMIFAFIWLILMYATKYTKEHKGDIIISCASGILTLIYIYKNDITTQSIYMAYSYAGIIWMRCDMSTMRKIMNSDLLLLCSCTIIFFLMHSRLKKQKTSMGETIAATDEHRYIKQKELNNSVFIGVAEANEKIYISKNELNQHLFCIGTTGAGKTTTFMNFVKFACEKGLPCVFMDGKGSIDLENKIEVLATQYGRKFRVFCLDDEKVQKPAFYNPFYSGKNTDWKNRLMCLVGDAEGRGQQHYAIHEEAFISLICKIIHNRAKEGGIIVDLALIEKFCSNPGLLLDKIDIKTAQGQKLHNELNKAIEDNASNDIAVLIKTIMLDCVSFDCDGQDNIINLKESLKNNEIILFLLDASSRKKDTQKIAKMIISDINASFSELANEEGRKDCICIFDEFGAYANQELAETLTLQRSNGLHALVGTQSWKSVKEKNQETKRIAEELLSCCNTYIIQQINHPEDAEQMAAVIGTKKTFEVTNQIDTESGASGRGSLKQVNEYLVNPQDIKELRKGEGYILQKALKNSQAKKIQINYLDI